MATHKELSFDWSILLQNYDQWTKTDLQLAAELGKTLLERNKELETTLKHHQNIIDDQAQEIIYLQKQTAALREVNDSRLKIYEQLEVGVQDLERSNHRLNVENNNHKKHIKTLVHNIENLECRCEELTKSLEDTKQTLTIERRKNERLLQEKTNAANDQFGVRLRHHEKEISSNSEGDTENFHANTTNPENCSFAFQSSSANNKNANSTGITDISQNEASFNVSGVGVEDNEEILRVVNDLESTKKALLSEQQRVGELEDQLVAIIQENQTLQGRLAQGANEEMKSVHEELSILEEVRQGNMCSRCLRACDDRLTVNDEASSIAPTEEDDDRSLLDMEAVGGGVESNGDTSSQIAYHRSAVTIKVASRLPPVSLELNAPASPNPYRDLVEKYEALLEVQRHSITRKNGVSLSEEFQPSGDYTSLHLKDNMDKNSGTNADQENTQSSRNSKNNRRTPTEFSEAETSSSGFSDETSNKGTQTDDRPGYFLCSIGDGEDCKFSIYDDASPIDSRFRNRPEYRELFKEIFAVLKKAAENKEEGDKLPLLDDTHPPAAKVPPVTPANEEMPSIDFVDDTQSIISSAISEQSFAMSECITKMERKTAKKHIIEKNQENQPPCASLSGSTTLTPISKQAIIENGRVLTPLKREPLEYLMVGVGIKKKSKKKNRNYGTERSESPAALPSPPRVHYSSGKKRRDMRPFNHSPSTSGTPTSTTQSQGRRPNLEWNGNSMIIYNRGVNSTTSPRVAIPPRGRELDLNGVEFRPSTVSQDLHKLKKLDLSYAEVLRRADACKQPYHRRK